VNEDDPRSVLRYKFTETLQKIITHSRYWGRIKAYVMFAFTSKYALTLYEAVCLRANLQASEQTFPIKEFRDLLNVPSGKLENFKSLKQWALDPAVLEVNALSDFHVEIEPIREGGMIRGKLTGFRLCWQRKAKPEWEAVLNELMRPKVGRKARISGAVEAVA
jgi:plasmid replication initiation protein